MSLELLRIRVLNKYDMIEAVQSCIKTVAEQYNMPSKEVYRLNLSVEEAMANVIKYGLTQNDDKYFEIALNVEGTEFTVIICDKGMPGDFILDNYEDKLGVTIMQHNLDRLMIKNLGSKGREQHLTKFLSSPIVFEKRFQEERIELPEDIKFDIHNTSREEAIEVARCIYDEFGFSYISEIVYYPERFYSACEEGKIYSIVATAPNGEIAGHLALTMLDDFPGVAEMGIGVVKKKYRKYAIMKHLTDKVLEFAKNANHIRALMAEPVAYHPITQKICESYELSPCGFNFHYVGSELKNSFADFDDRYTVGFAFKLFRREPIHQIYVPKQAYTLVENIYNSLNLGYEIIKPKEIQLDKSWITTKSIPSMKIGRIFLNQAGKDLDEQLKLSILTLKKEKCEVIFLYLNMSDDGIQTAYNSSVEHGFFCNGCFPMSETGDFLCMELIVNSVLDYSKLVTTEKFTKVLDMIKDLDSQNI